MSVEVRFRLERDGGFALDAELNVPDRGVTALFGRSGCGKTTLLRCMAGLEPSARGRIAVNGETWQDETRFLAPHRRAVGYVFQEPSLFLHLSVKKNLSYGLRRVPADRRRVAWEEAVELLGLEPLLDRKSHQLSGGQRQRAAIGRALLTSPRLLLLDEPLASLDAQSKAEIMPYLERLHEELRMPVIHVSHQSDEVARLADRLALMEDGCIRAVGPIGEMLARFDLPLAHASDAESILEARVADHDAEYHLTHLTCAGERFTVPREGLEVGRRVRLRILARDVSLTLTPQTGTSILNIFPARVEEMVGEGEAQVTVRLSVGDAAILSRITRKSAATLALAPGKQVYAQVKSVTLLT